MLFSIGTFRTCDFPGGVDPYPPLDPRMRMYDRSTCDIQIFKSSLNPIPTDRFSHAKVQFPLLKT